MMKKLFTTPTPAVSDKGAVQRWVSVWYVLEYLMLAAATLTVLLARAIPVNSRLIGVGFCLVYAAWFAGVIAGLRRWGRKSRLLGLSFVLIIPIIAAMTQINGVYFMLLFSLYGLVFAMLDTPMAIGVTALISLAGAVTIIRLNGLTWPDAGGLFLSFTLAFGVAVLFGLYITAIINQSLERQTMIEKLQAAQESQARAERQAGILEERQRLAREIHDTLAQGFTSVVMQLEAAEQDLAPSVDLSRARLHIDQARATARESLAEARRFVWALRSGPLERDSLADAIRRVAGRWAEESGVTARVEVDGEPHELPAPYEVALLRTAQESLANIRKHAQASQVTLTLTYLADQVSLDVADNGRGFDPDGASGGAGAPEGSGYGLLGLRERVEALGGSLSLESAHGEGATLAVALPLNRSTRTEQEAE